MATKAIVSFVNAEGGYQFAHWLRWKMMKKMKWFDPDDFFLDNVHTRNHKDYKFGGNYIDGGGNINKMYGLGKVFAAGRHDILGGAAYNDPLAPDHPDATWLTEWKKAFHQAKICICVITPAYLQNQREKRDGSGMEETPCSMERARIEQEMARNRKLKLVFLTFDKHTTWNTTKKNSKICCTKMKFGGGDGPFQALNDGFRVSDWTVRRLCWKL